MDSYFRARLWPYLILSERLLAFVAEREVSGVTLGKISFCFQFTLSFGKVLVLASSFAQPHLLLGYQHCLDAIDACCQQKGLGGQAAFKAAQDYAAKACPGGGNLEGHGGAVRLENRPGGGLCARMRLPARA